jgi:hypothetical protein
MSDRSIRIMNSGQADIELPAALALPKDPRERSRRLHSSRRLVPGLNVVPAAYFELVKTNPQVKALFDSRRLKVVAAGEEQDVTPKSTEGVSIQTAQVMINGCSDVEQLEAWAAKDTRREVLDSIIARLEIIESSGKVAKKGA